MLNDEGGTTAVSVQYQFAKRLGSEPEEITSATICDWAPTGNQRMVVNCLVSRELMVEPVGVVAKLTAQMVGLPVDYSRGRRMVALPSASIVTTLTCEANMETTGSGMTMASQGWITTAGTASSSTSK